MFHHVSTICAPSYVHISSLCALSYLHCVALQCVVTFMSLLAFHRIYDNAQWCIVDVI